MRSAAPCCMLPLYVVATLGLALLVHLATAQTQPAPSWLPALPWGASQQLQPSMLAPPTFDDAVAPTTPSVTLCTLVRQVCNDPSPPAALDGHTLTLLSGSTCIYPVRRS